MVKPEILPSIAPLSHFSIITLFTLLVNFDIEGFNKEPTVCPIPYVDSEMNIELHTWLKSI